MVFYFVFLADRFSWVLWIFGFRNVEQIFLHPISSNITRFLFSYLGIYSYVIYASF